MPDKIERITYHENVGLPFKGNWTCHIFTKNGSHYEGEGFDKGKAKEAAN